MQILKKCIITFIATCAFFCLAACDSDEPYLCSIDNGDFIEVTAHPSAKDYTVTFETPFIQSDNVLGQIENNLVKRKTVLVFIHDTQVIVSKNDKMLSQGIYIEEDETSKCIENIEDDTTSVLLETGEKDGNKYWFYSCNNSEYIHVILISNSNTGVMLQNTTSKESAEECFNSLSFLAVDKETVIGESEELINWQEYQFCLSEENMTLPCSLQKILDLGYNTDEHTDIDFSLKPGGEYNPIVQKGYTWVLDTNIKNNNTTETPVTECSLVGISQYASWVEDGAPAIVFPGDLTVGMRINKRELIEMFGEPIKVDKNSYVWGGDEYDERDYLSYTNAYIIEIEKGKISHIALYL